MPLPLSHTGFYWILLAVALYGVLHSFLASHTAKRLAARRLGQAWVDRYYRLAYSLIAGPTFLPPLVLAWVLPDQPLWRIPFPWVILTVLVQVAAATALLLSVTQSGAGKFLGYEQAFSPLHEPDPDEFGKPQELVTHGFYGWVRHPLYLFGLVVIWLWPGMTANILALVIGSTLYLLLGTIPEEKKLLADFGPAYADYRKRVPRILPRVSGNKAHAPSPGGLGQGRRKDAKKIKR